MLAALLAILVFLLVVEPLLVGLHELGHAIVPLALGNETAVFVGGKRGLSGSVGSLTLTVAPAGLRSPITEGAVVTDVQTGRWAVFAGTLGGPISSLLLAVTAAFALEFVRGPFLQWLVLFAFAYSTLQALSTLAPFRGPVPTDGGEPFKTDGRIALELLLGRDPVLDGDGGPLSSDLE
ncbi:hypothetical protein L593_01095 [Salinarchaeum sp. Harcht-Bsk1]|uniref:hypothetical protein n=1 Tax=Salinarchaeum sp. Harcht-Bsk1 TaxID=1333523 RepID=UPI0003422FBA|nr:hypothetical protein [Salinarchaeum sp. Harcht-Bsk1]AGN00172.1 hypothetical protein L593_01095 [Salinarchaeum sp. Harcht-Bsk1]